MATVLSKRCDTKEEILQNITDAEKNGITSFELQKNSDHYTLSYFINTKEKWDGECQCGHLHSQHRPISSVNYSAGRCTIGECRCTHFLHQKTTR